MDENTKVKRRFDIDNLRSGIVLLVIFYHIIYQFNSLGIIRNVDISGVSQMDVFIYLIYPWFMICLFVLAGISARYSLQTRTGKEFFRERVQKILVPSIAGILLLGWTSGYVTSQYTDMFMGQGDSIPALIKGLIYCITGIGPLWFCHELFLASLLLLVLRKIDKQDRLWKACQKANLLVIVLLVFAVWGSAWILNLPVIEVYRNGIYIFSFLLGYYLFSHEEIMEKLSGHYIVFLLFAVVLGIIYTITYWGQNPTTMDNLKGFLCNAYAYFMTLALLGCARAWFCRETRFTVYMRKRSFGFYVLHYPFMVMITFLLDKNFRIPSMLFYFVVLVLEAALLPVCYELVSRIPVLCRLLLGIY